MPKLTEKEILTRLDEVDGETLAAVERMIKAGSLPNNIKLVTGAPLRVINAVIACINTLPQAGRAA